MTRSRLEPQGRVILVSGANRGIGRAVAQALHEAGYSLSLGARRPDSLQPLVGAMEPARVLAHGFDARAAGAAEAWVAATLEAFGRIDGVVNNAGVVHDFSIESEDEALLDEMWEVNVKGPLRLTRAAFPHLKRSGHGRVVNVVSLSGKRVKSAGIAGYAMTKHAAAALTHATRFAGWDDGIRATAICPGFVATDMTAGVTSVGSGDMIQPDSVADLVLLALSLPNGASVVEIPVNCMLEPTC